MSDLGEAIGAGFKLLFGLLIAGVVSCTAMGVGWYCDVHSEPDSRDMRVCEDLCDPNFKGRAAGRTVAQHVGDECLCVQVNGDLRVPAAE